MKATVSCSVVRSGLCACVLLACGEPIYSPPPAASSEGAADSPTVADSPAAADLLVPLEEGASSVEGTAGQGASSEAPETPLLGDSVEVGGALQPSGCVIPSTALVPVGYGEATTGGGSAEPVVVRSFAEAQDALLAYRGAFQAGDQTALVLLYTGVFDYATITDVCDQHEEDAQRLEVRDMANVTIEGVQGSSGNFGIHITRASNVIVRNMTLGLLPGGEESDAISIEGNGTNGSVENIWVDHNELFSSTKDDCQGAGDGEFDGLLDIKSGARFVTVSYNYFHDHQGTVLLGFSDEDDTERYITFHHNRYENVASRTPLHRFGFMHAFNNYYGGISKSGINVRMGGMALVESNFFENAHNPVTSRYSDEVGFWELRNNHAGVGISWDQEPGTLVNAVNWTSTAIFPPEELGYAYEVDPPSCVKQIVRATAGATL